MTVDVEWSNIMEVRYRRVEEDGDGEEEEAIGVDLQTRRKSTPHHRNKSYSSSSSNESTVTSESSGSFEYNSVSMYTSSSSNNNNNNTNNNNDITITNGENRKVVEGRSDSEKAIEALSQADEEAEVEETKIRDNYINVSSNQDSTGFTVHQNGVSIVGSSVPESNGGEKETDIGSNALKNPETDVGLKNVESLLDESSNNINVTLSEKYNVENIVNKTITVKGQNEIVDTGPSQEIEPELEFDVEEVIQKQKTYDFYCPNCNSCITKRIILKRRKRKHQEISTDEGLKPERTVLGEKDTEKTSDGERNKDTEDPGARFGAVSCFSCFSIFIPKGDGFLWWRFRPKPDVSLQSDGTSLEFKDPEISPNDGTGKSFPLWILTCCQPNHIEKPGLKPGLKAPPILEDVRDNQFSDNEVPSSQSHDGSVPPKSQPSIIDPGKQSKDLQLTPKSPETANNHDFPLWFLSCCQPSTDRVKPELSPNPGPEVLTHEREPPSILSVVGTPEHPMQPPSILDTETKLTPESLPPVTEDEDVGTLVPDVPKPPVASEGDVGTLIPPAPKPSVASEGVDAVLPPPLKPQPTPEDEDTLLPSHLKPQSIPEDDIPSSTEPESSKSSTKGHVIVRIPTEPPTQSHLSDSGSASAINQHALLLPPQHSSPGVSGLDIIKAIVYGGLVECISSLSVISSAAGGDATTLNIVALGLANVFGGLVVLLHNVRVLKHEHSEDRYITQLGRPDYFLLHTVVAILSYLIFGLMSPVIYGFSFRKSDNKNYKLATLAAASLVCITVLSIGKAYVRRPPKSYIKTVFYYISMGVMVSGTGYVAGDLINMLLKKLGVFDSTAPVTMPGLEAEVVKGAWSSY